MIPKRYTSEAIVLDRKNYGEADRILVLFSKDYGKLSLIAKGVRKPKSRKRGSLEIFGKLKFAASKGKTLDILTESEILDSFDDIRKKLNKVALAYYFVEVIKKTTYEEEKNEKLYFHLNNFLKILRNVGVGLKKLKKNFVFETLVILGYWPENKALHDEDKILEEVTERKMNTIRVGRKLLK